MTPEQFANRLCAFLIAREMLREDTQAHYTLNSLAQEFFPQVEQAVKESLNKKSVLPPLTSPASSG